MPFVLPPVDSTLLESTSFWPGRFYNLPLLRRAEDVDSIPFRDDGDVWYLGLNAHDREESFRPVKMSQPPWSIATQWSKKQSSLMEPFQLWKIECGDNNIETLERFNWPGAVHIRHLRSVYKREEDIVSKAGEDQWVRQLFSRPPPSKLPSHPCIYVSRICHGMLRALLPCCET